MEAIVIARENKSGDKSLAAYIVPAKGRHPAPGELRQYLKGRLPDYALPSAFVILDSLPLTPNGKVDLKVLPEPDNFTSATPSAFVAPRNALEARLSLIWEKLLSIHPVGVTDNFFELGGHSLLAVRLLAEIKRVTGRDLPVAAFFRAPTIEQSVRALQKEGWSETFSFLINIQQGGAKLPLFWMQGQYSTLLSRFLEADQPLYLPIHQGLDGGPILNKSVEELARHYVREIRMVQPAGPYLLGGYCLGGLVALEIARRLSDEGDEVPLLFLVEPSRKCFPRVIPRDDTSTKRRLFRSRLGVHREYVSGLRATEKMRYILKKLPSAFNWFFGRNTPRVIEMFKMLVCKAYLAAGQPVPLSLRDLYLKNFDERIARNHTPRLYRGRIILCHSDHHSLSGGENPGHAPTGVTEMHHIAGADHVSILKEPYIGAWAGHLNRYLRELHALKEDNK
jgi:aspartate racemase